MVYEGELFECLRVSSILEEIALHNAGADLKVNTGLDDGKSEQIPAFRFLVIGND